MDSDLNIFKNIFDNLIQYVKLIDSDLNILKINNKLFTYHLYLIRENRTSTDIQLNK